MELPIIFNISKQFNKKIFRFSHKFRNIATLTTATSIKLRLAHASSVSMPYTHRATHINETKNPSWRRPQILTQDLYVEWGPSLPQTKHKFPKQSPKYTARKVLLPAFAAASHQRTQCSQLLSSCQFTHELWGPLVLPNSVRTTRYKISFG